MHECKSGPKITGSLLPADVVAGPSNHSGPLVPGTACGRAIPCGHASEQGIRPVISRCFFICPGNRSVACVLRTGRAMRTAHGALAALALIAPLATPGPGLGQTPSTDFRTYAVIASSQIKLGSGALVLGGNAAATDVDGILMVGKGASCPVLGDAVGDRAKLLNGANVGRLFSNEPILKDGSSINSGGPFQVTLPITFPKGASCEDGNLCTTGDSCIRGVCVGGPPPNCADTNPCTASTCVRDKGCVHQATLPNFTSCGPNGAVCFNGVCQ